MDNFTILNYQGSKNNLSSFIQENLDPYIPEGKAVFDIFSGSAAVSNLFRNHYRIFANDAECYASIIADAVLNQPDLTDPAGLLHSLGSEYESARSELAKPIAEYVTRERQYLDEERFDDLLDLYASYPTVWNQFHSEITDGPLTVESLRKQGGYDLFLSYYASNYYGIAQALDIDCIIKIIHDLPAQYGNSLFTCLFYAMKEAVFSKDGHMAQPLSLTKNRQRLFLQRRKNIYELFLKKFHEYLSVPLSRFSGKNKVFHADFEELLNDELFSDVGLVYADPPYTDMQYSRYYHLLNVAAKYEYPSLTVTRNGYTKGLYTEGRYQSRLSQHSSAGKSLEKLIAFCARTQTNLALSYAYPQDQERQATDRYTISIDDLIELARKYYTSSRVTVATQNYNHANHRNSAQKKVLEYLILCGDKNLMKAPIENLKQTLYGITPSKNNPMYNSHLYWSQKAFNVCDALISTLSNKGDVIFDPFLGSGVTTLEAVSSKLSRRAIGCDVNDMPLFISQVLLSVNSIPRIKEQLERFIGELRPLSRYYETACPLCGQTGIVSKVVFDKPERTDAQINIKTIHYTCECTGKGQKEADADDYRRIHAAGALHNITDTGLLHNSKLAVTEHDDIKNIFTGRSLTVLDEILTLTEGYDDPCRNLLHYILMSILHLCKITDTHSNSQWPLWIPKTNCVEKNIIEILTKKIRKFYDVVPFMRENYADAGIVPTYGDLAPCKCLLLKKGSQLITGEDIPDNGVDLIITDPPYLEQVLYSEYMQLYKPFFHLDYNLEDEIIVSSAPSRQKDRRNYFELLEQVFHMCHAKLKVGHYLCLYFHDSNLNVWNELIAILEKNCFRFITQVHIDKTVTLKNIISPKKSLNGDSILIFSRAEVPIRHNAAEELPEIERNIVRQAVHMVRSHGPLSTHELYDNGLMEILIQNGWLPILAGKYASLVDLLETHLYWNPEISKWEEK